MLDGIALAPAVGRGRRRRLGRRSSRRWFRRRAVATLVHELVELGAVLGGAQAVEELLELALLLVEFAQGLLAIFVEGDVAAAAAPVVAALPGTPLLARAAAGFATVASVPAAVAAMPRAKHASTPFQVDEKGEADRPEDDEA